MNNQTTNYLNQYQPESMIKPVIASGYKATFAVKKDGSILYAGDFSATGMGWNEFVTGNCYVSILASGSAVYGLTDDGKVKVAIYNTEFLHDADYKNKLNDIINRVSKWKDIVGVAACTPLERSYGGMLVVGITSEGKVISAADNSNAGQLFDFSKWQNIVSVSLGDCFAVGLNKDGEVLFAGNSEDIYTWGVDLFHDNPVNSAAVSCTGKYVILLDEDGNQITGSHKAPLIGEFKVGSDFDSPIVYVSSAENGIVGIRKNGTICQAKFHRRFNLYDKQISTDESIKEELSRLGNIIATSAGPDHVVCLDSDGSVYVAKNYYISQYRYLDGLLGAFVGQYKKVKNDGQFADTSDWVLF